MRQYTTEVVSYKGLWGKSSPLYHVSLHCPCQHHTGRANPFPKGSCPPQPPAYVCGPLRPLAQLAIWLAKEQYIRSASLEGTLRPQPSDPYKPQGLHALLAFLSAGQQGARRGQKVEQVKRQTASGKHEGLHTAGIVCSIVCLMIHRVA